MIARLLGLGCWLAPALLFACAPAVSHPETPPQVVEVNPGPPSPQAQPLAPLHAEPSAPRIEVLELLGKSLTAPPITQYIARREGEYTTSDFGDSLYYLFKREGISFLFKKGVLGTVFLYSEGYEGYQEYRGPLPQGLRFSDRAAEVRKRLGAPSVSGGGDGKTTSLGPVPRWDKYQHPTWSLHFQYAAEGQIELVTLMTANDDPNRGREP